MEMRPTQILKIEDIKGKTIEDVFQYGEYNDVYIKFTDNSFINLTAENGWDGGGASVDVCLNYPSIHIYHPYNNSDNLRLGTYTQKEIDDAVSAQKAIEAERNQKRETEQLKRLKEKYPEI